MFYIVKDNTNQSEDWIQGFEALRQGFEAPPGPADPGGELRGPGRTHRLVLLQCNTRGHSRLIGLVTLFFQTSLINRSGGYSVILVGINELFKAAVKRAVKRERGKEQERPVLKLNNQNSRLSIVSLSHLPSTWD